jgi:hypothetical protein
VDLRRHNPEIPETAWVVRSPPADVLPVRFGAAALSPPQIAKHKNTDLDGRLMCLCLWLTNHMPRTPTSVVSVFLLVLVVAKIKCIDLLIPSLSGKNSPVKFEQKKKPLITGDLGLFGRTSNDFLRSLGRVGFCEEVELRLHSAHMFLALRAIDAFVAWLSAKAASEPLSFQHCDTSFSRRSWRFSTAVDCSLRH